MSRRYLVTGTSRGIGAAVARSLIAGGNRVFGVQRSSAEASEDDWSGVANFSLLQHDLCSPRALAAVIDEIPERLDGVVLNAGIAFTGGIETRNVEGVDPIERCIDVNLVAPLRLCRALLSAGRVAERGSWVFVSSNLAHRGLAGKVAYSAAKAGLEAAVRALAHELGPRGMRVNAVAPGLVATKMTVSLGAEGYAAYADQVPLGRVGEVEDIVGPIQFFLNSGSEYVSGTVLTVDGGWSC